MKIRRNPNQIILISVHLFMHRAGVGTSNRWKWNESKNWWCQPKTNRIMDSHGHWSRSSGCEIVQASTRVCICLSFSTFKKFQWNSNSLSNQTNETKAKIWNKISHSRKSNWLNLIKCIFALFSGIFELEKYCRWPETGWVFFRVHSMHQKWEKNREKIYFSTGFHHLFWMQFNWLLCQLSRKYSTGS